MAHPPLNDASPPVPRRPTVRSVERVFEVIKAFGPSKPALSLSEVAQATGLDRATARRLLLTLDDLGYVRQQGRSFSLTPRILELGHAYLSSTDLVGTATPHLRALAIELNETASLTVLDGDDIVYTALAYGPNVAAVRITVGTRFAAYATSMGRVLLAGLAPELFEDYLRRLGPRPRTETTVTTPERIRAAVDRVRETGWALADGELNAGLRGIAVPVLDHDGATVAAVNVSVHAARATRDELEQHYLGALRACASAVSADLGYR